MLISGSAPIAGSYDYAEVARSVLIAIAASYVALDLAGRVTAARGRVRLAWLWGGATAMGIGIWEMHFKGMLAFRLPVPVEYHWPTLLAALLVAIFASAVALYGTSRHAMGRVEALTGSVVMGGGIVGMHYIGMAAMRLPAVTRYSPLLVACSVLLAILFSLIALLMAFGLREETRWTVWRRSGSAVLLGVAVSAMHYTGMAAASFFPSSPADLSHAVSITPLGDSGVVAATLLVLLGAVITSSVDRRKLQDQLRLVINSIPAMVWSALPDGSVDFVNQRWLDYFGRPLEKILGHAWMDALHPEDRDHTIEKWRAAIASGEPLRVEARLRRGDGQYRWFVTRGVPLRDERGNIVKWYGTKTDIEERKRAEAWVSLQRRVLEMIARGLPLEEILTTLIRLIESECPPVLGSILLLDEDGRHMRHGAALSLPEAYVKAIDGQPIGPKAGSCGTAMYRKEPVVVTDIAQDPLWDDYRDVAVAHGLRACWSTPILSHEGRVLGSFAMYYAEPHSPGTSETRLIEVAVYLAGIAIERRRAEEDLRQSETRLRAFFKHSPNLIFMKDPQGRYLYVNPEVERVLRITEEQIKGKRDDEIFPQEWAAGYQANDRQVLQAGTPVEFEEIFVKEGRPHTTIATKFPLFNAEGAIYAIGGVATDITERKRTEAALQEAQAELARITRIATMGELTASIAHEINQPLGAVATNGNAALRWLAGQPPNLAEVREAVERIIREANRASDVIGRIRALLQKTPPQTERLDINAVIREVLTLAHSELQRGGVSVQEELAPDVPKVLGDRVQLRQVLLNLILNAIDSMSTVTDRPRKLVVRSAQHPEGALIQVQDSGTGLDPALLDHIFEPFFTTKPEGIGMGLAIGRSIVEALGGRLWATSESSRGAVFQFTLPKAVDERAA